MEIVNGLELYHVRRLEYGFLEKGQIIDFGSTANRFWGIYEGSKELPLYDDIPYLKSVATYYWKYLRESVFEEVRLKEFPKLPSRQTCLFLADSHYLSKWIHHLNCSDFEIYKMKLTGNLQKCDASLIDIHPNNKNVVRDLARRYYSGEIVSNSEKIEYLFEGKAEIIGKVNLNVFN